MILKDFNWFNVWNEVALKTILQLQFNTKINRQTSGKAFPSSTEEKCWQFATKRNAMANAAGALAAMSDTLTMSLHIQHTNNGVSIETSSLAVGYMRSALGPVPVPAPNPAPVSTLVFELLHGNFGGRCGYHSSFLTIIRNWISYTRN